jgi:hypothetical protein
MEEVGVFALWKPTFSMINPGWGATTAGAAADAIVGPDENPGLRY